MKSYPPNQSPLNTKPPAIIVEDPLYKPLMPSVCIVFLKQSGKDLNYLFEEVLFFTSVANLVLA